MVRFDEVNDSRINRRRGRVKMNAAEFERMLSTRLKIKSAAGHEQEAPCLRDLVFDYFYGKYPNDAALPQARLDEYTDSLYNLLVKE